MANYVLTMTNPLVTLYGELADSKAVARGVRESESAAAQAAAALRDRSNDEVLESFRASVTAGFKVADALGARPALARGEKMVGLGDLASAIGDLVDKHHVHDEDKAMTGVAEALAATKDMLRQERRSLLAEASSNSQSATPQATGKRA